MNTELINTQKELAKAYMLQNDPEHLYVYHDWSHIQRVLKAIHVIVGDEDIDEPLIEDLLLAGIWHDADYAKGAKGHEARSATLAMNHLKDTPLTAERLQRIERLIHSTDTSVLPVQDDERIIKDADLAHLGSPQYMKYYELLRKEINNQNEVEVSEDHWLELCLDFLSRTHYHTKAANLAFGERKTKNVEELVSQARAKEQIVSLSKAEKKRLKKEKKRKKKKAQKLKPQFKAEKGIETMFRIALKNHVTLSRIADEKANTLISVNAIILSIVLSALFPKLDSNPWLLYPGISLILVSIITIVLSTLSTIPKTTHGEVSREDVTKRKGNLLFFGNFHKMSLPDYEWGVGELMRDGDYLYGTLTRDLYFLGLVLNKKYSLLRYAYFAFVIGLMVSIMLFMYSVIVWAPDLNLPEVPAP